MADSVQVAPICSVETEEVTTETQVPPSVTSADTIAARVGRILEALGKTVNLDAETATRVRAEVLKSLKPR